MLRFELFTLWRSFRLGFLVLIILVILFYTCVVKNDNSFDHLIFTQRWLPTSCFEYMEKNSSSNNLKCELPENYDIWAIHGLWPTKNHNGPFFCNKTMHFNKTALEPIESVLKENWPNIEEHKSVSSLWKHEWDKHGTCAAQLELLNSEIKYFNTTLALFFKYNIMELFQKNQIVPSNDEGVRVIDIFYLIQRNFGKNPFLHCYTEVESSQALLADIRMCLDKTLQLIDCEESPNRYIFADEWKILKTFTNCPLDSVIFLPDKIDVRPPQDEVLQRKLKSLRYYNTMIEIFKGIKLLQWILV